MGRWAQRKRSGGGPPDLNYIIRAERIEIDAEELEYANPVDGSRLLDDTFQSNPSTETNSLITQLSPTVLVVGFTGNIAADTTLVYTGAVPGIRTPQTINLL